MHYQASSNGLMVSVPNLNPPALYAFNWADGNLEIVEPQSLR
jgi:hypothetical protein